MSESVKITVIIEKKDKSPHQINVTHDSSMTLMSTLLKNKLVSDNFCGGRGDCQRCRVQFLQMAPLPTNMERNAFTPEELRQGYRLACMVKPKDSSVIRLDFMQSKKIDIITNMIEMSAKHDCGSQKDNDKTAYLIAVDLGTTTIAMQLMDMASGQAVDTYCAMNPQRSYGADVLSRIQAANMGNAKALQESVWEVLYEGMAKFQHKIQQISCMCIAGNTAMEHLLMGLPTEQLGKSPFLPAEIGLQKCELASSLPVYVLPGFSAFVGGDIVAGLYHCNLLGTPRALQKPDNREVSKTGAVLFIDLGTNGEMAITDRSRMIVTATAAGPAFEGGAGRAAVGSDMVAITASLLEKGMIDETGLLAEPFFEEGITVSGQNGTEPFHLQQKDIRNLQMAKAAVRAGVEILCRKMGYPEITKVYLAGGFGYYLDVDAAVAIGLLPESLRQYTQAAGNTSLAGAFDMGKDLCLGVLREEALEAELRQAESINLAKQDDFEELYLSYLNFPPVSH